MIGRNKFWKRKKKNIKIYENVKIDCGIRHDDVPFDEQEEREADKKRANETRLELAKREGMDTGKVQTDDAKWSVVKKKRIKIQNEKVWKKSIKKRAVLVLNIDMYLVDTCRYVSGIPFVFF